MRLSKVGQRLATVLTAAAISTAGALVGPALPAHAGLPPFLESDTSPFDATSPKNITVSCPYGSLFAVGGEINGNDGSVLMTRMHPDSDLRTAIVRAEALHPGSVEFSVTVYAVCINSSARPTRVSTSDQHGSTVSTECTGQDTMLGFGFALDRPLGSWRVDSLLPSADMKQATVHVAGGSGTGSLTAFGICYFVARDQGEPAPFQVSAQAMTNGNWPTTVITPTAGGTTFGIGGSVTGSGFVHLDALVPLTRQDAAVRGTRANTAAQDHPAVPGAPVRTAPGAHLVNATGGEDGSVFVSENRSGTFH
jgi:hypothetical protein